MIEQQQPTGAINMRFSTVLHSDVKDFGLEEAYALSNMLTLHKNCANDDGSFIYCWSLAQEHGVTKSESAFRRLIKRLVALNLIQVQSLRRGGSTINFYWLTDTYLSRKDTTTIQKDRTNKTASVGKSEAAKRSVVKQQIQEGLSDFQRDKDATLADSPVVEYTVDDAEEPVQAYLKGTVLPKGIYEAVDSGESVYILSNGKDTPVRVSKRFKLELAQNLVRLGLNVDTDMVVPKHRQ